MPEWMGKKKVVNHHNDVPFHVLERKWDYGRDGLRAVRDGRDGARPSQNMIIHGDNLVALSAEELEKLHITFKKVPRDVTRF